MAGRRQVEAELECQGCAQRPYTLYRVQDENHPEVWTHRLWPTPGVGVPPPDHPTRLRCPFCGEPLTRKAPTIRKEG